MTIFSLRELDHYNCKSKVFALESNGKCAFDEFKDEIKSDANLRPELGDLIPSIKYFANATVPFLPKNKFRKLELGKKIPYSAYEAKSDHLRLYLFTEKETGIIIILGGKKTDQDKDIQNVKTILKEYKLFKLKK